MIDREKAEENGPVTSSDAAFEPLRARRVVLRRFRPSDAEAFARYRSDPEVARYQGWDAPYALEHAARFAAAMAAGRPDTPGEWFQVAVALRDTEDDLIGDCAFSPRADEPRTVEIGFTFAPAHQGHGYAREAVTALLGYLFERLGKHRVTASCDPRNARSRRLLEVVGMREEGHLVESTWCGGEWADDLLFAVLSREWPR